LPGTSGRTRIGSWRRWLLPASPALLFALYGVGALAIRLSEYTEGVAWDLVSVHDERSW
jgi:hypothetical protein